MSLFFCLKQQPRLLTVFLKIFLVSSHFHSRIPMLSKGKIYEA
jgi:hypothetical protein